MTPAPFENSAVRLVDSPAATLAGFAVKLLIAGATSIRPKIPDAVQPARLLKTRLRIKKRANDRAAADGDIFMTSPV
jgi:hypothetical protein